MAPYHRPTTLEEALAVSGVAGMRIAAGCTDLFPATDRPELGGPVLDITGIDALRGISRDRDHIRIGATTRWTDLIRADLPPAFDMLKQAAAEVGSVQIQNSGTVAGNICNASPAADGMPCLLALDAKVEIASRKGLRQVPLSRFVTGVRRTALAPGELVTGVLVPHISAGGESRFLKLGARKYLVISIAMIAARLESQGGRITGAAIAVGACSAVATRLPALEAALTGRPADAGLAGLVTKEIIAPALSPIDDIRADAVYRTDAAAELIRRALTGLTRPRSGAAA